MKLFFRRLIAPGLLRTQLSRTLLVGVVPLAILAVAVLTVSDGLIYQRFEQESTLVANGLAADIEERVLLVARDASLIAEIQQVRDVITSGDLQSVKAQLLPLKGRLGLDIVNVADPTTGTIIVGAQDTVPGEKLSPALLQRATARVESAWVLDGEDPAGVVVRAVAPVRSGGRTVAVVEAGTLLDDRFLMAIQDAARGQGTDASLADLAIIWDRKARATTVADLPTASFPTVSDIDAQHDRSFARTVTFGGKAYYAVFTLIESHQTTLGVLAAFVPLASVEAAHNAILTLIVALIGALVVGITILAYRFTTSLTHPLGQLAAAAQAIESGDLSVRIPANAPHEIGRLERSFDTMVRSLAERDATNRQLVAELQVQALNDSLTSLPNRILFQDRLQQQIFFSSRQRMKFAVFVMDLDRFKEVNDTFGHPTGDRLLVMVGERIRASLRDSDTVARFGGDEFALLIPTADTDERAVEVARKIQKAFEAPFTLDGFLLNVEASTGITMYPDHGEDPQTLVKRADAAMYVAKRDKSGYTVYAPSEDFESRDRLLLMGEFRQAIERDELVLNFQPEVEPRSGEIVGVEALVRWDHPSRGLLSPDQFIPFAEQTGLIRPLTHWVIDNALRQARPWRTRSGQPMRVAVNLSARDFQDPELPEHVVSALRRSNMDASRLKLEITENAVMADAARSMETLTTLREMGVQLSIDDFGTGYSSLSYLKRLPVDEIKIDRSFVIDIVADTGASAIVRATIELAHSLRCSVVAEGAEDQATVALLASFGCDAVQGYYYTMPLSGEEFARLIAGTPLWDTRGRLVDLQSVPGPGVAVAS